MPPPPFAVENSYRKGKMTRRHLPTKSEAVYQVSFSYTYILRNMDLERERERSSADTISSDWEGRARRRERALPSFFSIHIFLPSLNPLSLSLSLSPRPFLLPGIPRSEKMYTQAQHYIGCTTQRSLIKKLPLSNIMTPLKRHALTMSQLCPSQSLYPISPLPSLAYLMHAWLCKEENHFKKVS